MDDEGNTYKVLPTFDSPNSGGNIRDFVEDLGTVHGDILWHWSSFFRGNILENMVFCTNTFGNLYLLNWVNTCADEMLAFISITIYMGIYIFHECTGHSDIREVYGYGLS